MALTLQTPTTLGRRPLRVAFIVDVFPMVSETFVIEQVAQLIDRSVDIEVFAFRRGDERNVSEKFASYRMAERTRYLDGSRWSRLAKLVPTAATLARSPRTLARALNVRRFGADALSLKLLFRAAALKGRHYDVVHCHFGTTARSFLAVRGALADTTPLVTSLYGYDVSKTFREESVTYYDELKKKCQLFFVMSDDMRRRVVAGGFPAERVVVHPVSIDVDAYPHALRRVTPGEKLRIVSVGRFVEKKGFDDLLSALAVANSVVPGRLECSIVGGGPLEPALLEEWDRLGLHETVRFLGYRSMEDVLGLFMENHIFVQPSKTASDGDME